jgi:hypothetical protein
MDDLRTPIGLFFSIIGVILIGVATLGSARAPLTDININLYAGLCMLVFGGAMLWLARRAS